jgi:hypothetical protein
MAGPPHPNPLIWQDLLILIIGFCFPMVSVVIDGLTYGSAVTISPPEYWALFGFGT